MSALLDANAIRSSIHCQAEVSVYKSIDSTNACLRRRYAALKGGKSAEAGTLSSNDGTQSFDRAVVIACEQTAGRGRSGRTFASPAGAGIYLSLLHSPRGGISSPQIITALAAVAVCRAIKSVYQMDAKIKWVNDIFLRGKKVCGILTEGIAESSASKGTVTAAIIGIGVNILPGALPKEICDVAGTVLDCPAADPKMNELAACIIDGVYCLLDAAGEEGEPLSPVILNAMSQYKALSILTGRQVAVHPIAKDSINMDSVNAAPYTATVLGITDDASLLVRTEDGKERALHSGEVTLVSSQIASSCDV